MRLLLQLILMVRASDKFGQFVNQVQAAPTMEDTPLSTWLVPSWRQRLESMERPTVEEMPVIQDAKIQEALTYLANFPLEVGRWSSPINEFLQQQAKKIAALLLQDPPSSPSVGLKEYVLNLASNVRNYPILVAHISGDKEAIAWRSAALIGLGQARVFSVGLLSLIVKHILRAGEKEEEHHGAEKEHHGAEGEHHGAEGEHEGEILSGGIASLLSELRENVNDIPQMEGLINRLHAIDASSLFHSGILSMLLEMIPLGQRFAFGFQSKGIVDLIKAEDGRLYGILYAASNSYVFCLPGNKLSSFVHSLCHGHGLEIGEHSWQAVKLKWLDNKQPLAYALGGHATLEHLAMGAILEYCRELEERQDIQDMMHADILDLIQKLSPANAQKIYEIITNSEISFHLHTRFSNN